MYRLKNLRTILCAFLISVFLGTSATVVYANSVNSNDRNYGPVNGYKYYNNASVINNTNLCARTWVMMTEGGNQVPTGYMGGKARLYTSGGSLKRESEWIYNDQPIAGYGVYTNNYNQSGTYYSKGISAAYNGNGYTTYSTYQSPNLTR